MVVIQQDEENDDMLQSSRIKTEFVLKTKKSGIDLIGVASIERFDHAPQGHKPTDIMIEAKSVIVLVIR